MSLNRKLDYVILDLIQTSQRTIMTAPLNLGGVPGSGGGEGAPPGGFVGWLPQIRVAYDTDEIGTLYTPPSGQSLLDNLNHIRYRINILESGASIWVVDDDIPQTFEDIDTIHFSGEGITVTNLGGGEVRVTVLASGGAGAAISVQELDGSPLVTNVDKIIFSGATVTDLGSGDVLVSISGSGGPGTIIIDEFDGDPSISGVDKIIFSGATVIDMGGGDVRVAVIEQMHTTNILYLSGLTADVSEDAVFMRLMTPAKDPTAGPQTGTNSAVAAGEYKWTRWITRLSSPFLETLSKCQARFYITAKRDSGTRDVKVKFKFYKQNSGGTQTFLCESEESPILTASYVMYEVVNRGFGPVTLDPTDRLVAKLYLVGGSTGTDASVSIQYDNTDGERMEITLPNTQKAPASLFEARLSLSSSLPVPTADAAAQSTLYLHPYKGNQISLYNGTYWETHYLTAAISLTLTGLATASRPYDIFIYINNGVLTLDSVVWTNDTTRATALATQDGVYVKSGSTGYKYVGTVYIDGSKQSSMVFTLVDSVTKVRRHVWNYYNRINQGSRHVSTASHTYASATYRLWNNTEGLTVEIVMGVLEDDVLAFGGGNQHTNAGFDVALNWSSGGGELVDWYNTTTSQISAFTGGFLKRYAIVNPGLLQINVVQNASSGTATFNTGVLDVGYPC